jgi:NAD(P)-dependent dehydrogenase (short-subunit alcohol dehydrogenase family)
MNPTDIRPTSPDACIPGRFAGKVMLVTGAAIGSIGGCTAIRAAREGARVVCVDIKEPQTLATVDHIRTHGGEAHALIADLTRAADADRMVADTTERYGRLDLVLNAAGVMDGTSPAAPQDFDAQQHLLPAGVHTATDEYWHAVFAGNIHSMFYAMRAELRQLVAQGDGGAIVNIGSIAGLIGLPGNPAYSASKHAIIGLTRNAAIDYAPHGIRVNAVNMAQTDTPMVARAYEFVQWVMAQGHGASMAGAKSQSLLQIADSQHRGATPWEQAAIILFLLSEDASNITGAAYATDGGWTAY